jgi:hypothetical protein
MRLVSSLYFVDAHVTHSHPIALFALSVSLATSQPCLFRAPPLVLSLVCACVVKSHSVPSALSGPLTMLPNVDCASTFSARYRTAVSLQLYTDVHQSSYILSSFPPCSHFWYRLFDPSPATSGFANPGLCSEISVRQSTVASHAAPPHRPDVIHREADFDTTPSTHHAPSAPSDTAHVLSDDMSDVPVNGSFAVIVSAELQPHHSAVVCLVDRSSTDSAKSPASHSSSASEGLLQSPSFPAPTSSSSSSALVDSAQLVKLVAPTSSSHPAGKESEQLDHQRVPQGLGAFVGVGSRGSYRSAIRILDRDRTSADSRRPDILVILIALSAR